MTPETLLPADGRCFAFGAAAVIATCPFTH